MIGQVLWGTAVLALCGCLHVGMVAASVPFMGRLSYWAEQRTPALRTAELIAAAFAVIVIAHLAQVAIWASALVLLQAMPDFAQAVYFAIVTYTTLGYGDVTLEAGYAVFGSFAAITGLLTFGVSTAFLVGVVARVLPRSFGD